MRPVYLIVFTLLPCLSFSQSLKFIVNGGINESKISEPITDFGKRVSVRAENYDEPFLTGFRVGGMLEIPIKKFSITAGAEISSAGGKFHRYYDIPGSPLPYYYDERTTVSTYYASLPLNLLYHFNIKNRQLFVGAGPYLAYGLSGKAKSTITYLDGVYHYNSDVLFENKDPSERYGRAFKNPDYGVNALVGIYVKQYLKLSLGFNYGLRNLSYENTFKDRNEAFNLSVGYIIK